jgi:hypothetical protein
MNSITEGERQGIGWDIGAHLRKENYKGKGADERRLTAHVGASYEMSER